MKLFIVIVNYKKYLETKSLLMAIKNNLSKYNPTIILVDNNSSKEINKITKEFPKLTLIKNDKNLGFSKAVNQGISESLNRGATKILLLNYDTIIDHDFLSPLLTTKYDIVSPILKFKRKGEWVYDFGGKINWLIGRPYHLETRNTKDYESRIMNLKLDYVSGCAMMINKDIIEKIGLFSEDYFLYFEDVEFCLRAKKQGFKIGVEPKSILIHKLEEDKNESRKFKLSKLLNSHRVFINKRLPFYFKPFAYLYIFFLKLKIND